MIVKDGVSPPFPQYRDALAKRQRMLACSETAA